MAHPEQATVPEKVILVPVDPLYTAVRRAGGCTGRDRRLDLFRYALIPACENRAGLSGPALGAPAAILLAERLVRSGAKEILLFSVCGSLTPELRIGDLFTPTGGLSEEGTSRLYSQGSVPPPDPELLGDILQKAKETGIAHREGLIWTTDAPHRESPEKIASFRDLGALAVDMEFTALATLAKFHGIKFAALMVVSDEPFRTRDQAGFHQPRFRHSLRTAARTIVDVLKKRLA